MKKATLLFMCIILVGALCACAPQAGNIENRITVAVGVVPEATFVEKVAGDLVNVVTLIPPGNSPANYQPTATEMQALSDASVYFAMQTPTEEANIIPKVYDFNKDIIIVNLRDTVSKTHPNRTLAGHEHDERESTDEHEVWEDPHIWLSPKRAAVIVQTIADELSRLDEQNSKTYMDNAKKYLAELNELDKEISSITDGLTNKSFMIYHGAYGYFADDYGLEMISLESDGKPATAAGMQSVIEQAKSQGVATVFFQTEFDDSQAKTVADEIGGTVLKAAPLSPDYIESLRSFANALKERES